jgi:hypothetical protein
VVDINQGLSTVTVLLKRNDGNGGLLQEGDEFILLGGANISADLFDSAYDGNSDSAYIRQVLINDNGRVLNYRIRLQNGLDGNTLYNDSGILVMLENLSRSNF